MTLLLLSRKEVAKISFQTEKLKLKLKTCVLSFTKFKAKHYYVGNYQRRKNNINVEKKIKTDR